MRLRHLEVFVIVLCSVGGLTLASHPPRVASHDEGQVIQGHNESQGHPPLVTSNNEGQVEQGRNEGHGHPPLLKSKDEGQVEQGRNEGHGHPLLAASKDEGQVEQGRNEDNGHSPLLTSNGEGQVEQGRHEGQGHPPLVAVWKDREQRPSPIELSTASLADPLEDELVKLRYPGDESEYHHTSPYSVAPRTNQDDDTESSREDQDDELTEVRPLDIPVDHHEAIEDQFHHRFVSSTVPPFHVDIPLFEPDNTPTDVTFEDDNSDHSGDSSTLAPRHEKRSSDDEGSDDDDDDDDGDDDVYDDSDEDDDDDDDDFEDDDESGKVEKRGGKETSQSPEGDEEVTEGNGEDRRETNTGNVKGGTTRDALMRDFDAFRSNAKRSLGEAEFQGLSKLTQIREIDKRISRELKDKYVDAVDPKADEDLLELMVKIAENPTEWRTVHRMLQQMDQDLLASHNAVNMIKEDEYLTQDTNEMENAVTTTKPIKNKSKANAEKKKKKKKKLRNNKEVTKQEEITTMTSVESARRDDLLRAGILAARAQEKPNTDRQDPNKKKLPKPSTSSAPNKAKEVKWLPKELLADKTPVPLGANDRMTTLDSAIEYLTTHKSKGINNKNDHHRMKVVKNDRWPKEMLGVDQELDTAKAIVSGELKPSQWIGKNNLPRVSQKQVIPKTNTWSRADIKSDYIPDKEAARAKFLKDTLVAKNNAVYLQPNARATWLEASPMPSKEQRANYNNNYYNSNYNKAYDWPQISLDSLKHGNIVADQKNWPEFDDDNSYNKAKQNQNNNWPNFPADSETNKVNDDNWPRFSNNEVSNKGGSGRGSNWDKYSSALDTAMSNHREMMASRWSPGPPQKPSITVSHPKDNKQWPHFAYHRVTSSPQTMARHQKEAQQRARHRNAYIAVSIIAPPNKNKAQPVHKLNTSAEHSKQVNNVEVHRDALPDKMDELLDARGENDPKLTHVDPLEEQLIDMASTGSGTHTKFNWDHSRHLDKIQEQLKTLSDMEEKLHFQWLEKERLRQILRDGGKSASYYRQPRDGSRDKTVSTSAPSPTTTTTHLTETNV